MMEKSIIIARGGEQQSRLETYFQKLGAKTMSFPILKSTEQELPIEVFSLIAKKHRLIFLNPTSIQIFFRQYTKSGITANLPEQIEYLSEKSRKVLEARGIKANLASYQKEQHAVLLGHDYQHSNVYSEDDLLIHTHHIGLDFSFEKEMSKTLNETDWQTVIFPNMLSIDFFVKYCKTVADFDYTQLALATVGKKVQEYAFVHGFSKIDSEIQAELLKGDWKNL
ncbi:MULTISPECIES: hypothetical protein [Bacillaceae]|uniref:hypothetical protein n=1 Tax=Bacillaceae TaxID=186817 RepID=UPI001E39785D|nr:hypothetical protein [Bacillus sp. Au-Bac7]MCE4047972.1 hypothetical protein [Bacillus sp. Au-Bac7]